MNKKLLQALAMAAMMLQAAVVVKPDVVEQGGYRVFDDKGKMTQTWKPDPLFPDRQRVYDNNGRYQGTIKPDPLFNQKGGPRPPTGTRIVVPKR